MGLRAGWATSIADYSVKLGQSIREQQQQQQRRQSNASYAAAQRVSMPTSKAKGSKFQVNASAKVDLERRCALRERRIELEQDVAQLRKRLVKEENIHKVLERAFSRPIGALPRLPQYLPPQARRLLAEVAVLEEEVVRLEDHVLSMQQDLEDEIVYSSMFSKQQQDEAVAGLKLNKHFSSSGDKRGLHGKKDVLIARLLPSKEEKSHKKGGLQVQKASIANELPQDEVQRAPPTVQQQDKNLQKSQLLNSFGATFEKRGVREKYFGSLTAVQEEREKENLQQHLKETLPLEDSEVPPAVTDVPADSRKVNPSRLSNCGPNKVSEEMVRCLIGIYGMMTRLYSLSDSDASSVVSRSTLSSFSSGYGSKCSSASTKAALSSSLDADVRDPYGVSPTSSTRDIGPYRYFQNIGADSFDYSRIPNSASLFRRLRGLIGKLARVDLQNMSQQQKLAFWINIYNACMMNAFLEYGIPCGPHQVVALMRKATLNVGGYSLNALAIEHFILRLPSHSKHAFVKLTSKDKAQVQSALGLDWPDPLVCFALCCGSKSSPAVRAYTAGEVEAELETAKREYLHAAVGVNAKGKVVIPKLLEWNLRDFAKDRESLLDWICDQLPCDVQQSIQECRSKANGLISSTIQVMPYDFNFRYLLSNSS